MGNRPSDAVILERAKSFCSEACSTVALQHRRLRTTEPEDGVFVFRWHADLQFMIVALRRLRRAAELATHVAGVSPDLKVALRAFDDSVPNLAKMRNVGEHVDEYLLGLGRSKNVARSELQVSMWNGSVFNWQGVDLDIDLALKAAETLFSALAQSIERYTETVACAHARRESRVALLDLGKPVGRETW
jgi:hypothetical protein